MNAKVLFDCKYGWLSESKAYSFCKGVDSPKALHDPATVKAYTSTNYPGGILLLCQGQIDRAEDLWRDSVLVLAEGPCCHCGKPNDGGVKVCWWCGNQP